MGIAIVVGIFLVVGIIVFLVWWFSDDQKTRRYIKSIPITRIGDVTDGQTVRLVGRVRALNNNRLNSPLSGRACTYYRVIVQEQRGSGKSRHWVRIIDDHNGVDFLIEDDTGRARITVAHTKPLLVQDQRMSSGFLNDASPLLEEYLMGFGHQSKGMLFNKTMKYDEGVVEEGETVVIVGTAKWEDDPDPQAGGGTYRERSKRLVVQGPPPAEPLILSDEPKLTQP